MLVAKISRGRAPTDTARSCSAADKSPCRLTISRPRPSAMPLHDLALSRISRAPGKNTSTLPSSPVCPRCRRPSPTRAPSSRSPRIVRYSISTGWLRPGERSDGASRNADTGPGSSVADMTTIRRSGRDVVWSRRSSVSARSVSTCRSWNSSSTTADTPRSLGSSRRRRTNKPSVTKRIRVASLTRDSKRTW